MLHKKGALVTRKPRDGDNNCGKTQCPAAKKINYWMWYLKNAEVYKKNKKIYYAREDIKAAGKVWRERDGVKAKRKGSTRKWKAANPERVRSNIAKYQARKKQAMPSWLTQDHMQQIHAVYAEAHRLSVETGTPYDVDHIVPLLGRVVCGLHVPWNLRAIPAVENRRRPRIYKDGMA
jgi:hypothetical protein